MCYVRGRRKDGADIMFLRAVRWDSFLLGPHRQPWHSPSSIEGDISMKTRARILIVAMLATGMMMSAAPTAHAQPLDGLTGSLPVIGALTGGGSSSGDGEGGGVVSNLVETLDQGTQGMPVVNM